MHQAQLLADGKLEDLADFNEMLSGTGRPHHAVLFAGERFGFETAELTHTGISEWFNWGCAGSSAAKLHLSGHTEASSPRLGIAEPSSDLRQAALYAFTATYCPGAQQSTVPGQPIRIAEARGVIPREGPVSFHPSAAGAVEAQWGPSGATCISVPRLEDQAANIWDDILAACGDLPPCPEQDDLALTDAIPFATFNLAPDSCHGRCGEPGCDSACTAAGTCDVDYAPVCGP